MLEFFRFASPKTAAKSSEGYFGTGLLISAGFL
jgi:hypothetical protein